MYDSDEIEQTLPKPLVGLPQAKKVLQGHPKSVRYTFGQALWDAQCGKKHYNAKPLKGFGGAGVLEVVENDDGNTYRAVYTVKFPGVVYVLHVFQKKSKTGSKTPTHEIEKLESRLKDAENHYAEWIKHQKRAQEDQE